VSSLIEDIGREISISKQEELLTKADSTKETITHLCDALKNGTQKNRANAAWSLGWIKAEDSFNNLVQALNDDYWNARSNALCALFNIDSKRARPYLEVALSDPDEDIRENAKAMLS
jgi:HEAT repeat protein